MNPNDITNPLNTKLKAAAEHFAEELKKLRTGRAHPSMVEDIMAEAYGTPMSLKTLATISTPEAQLIQISPFDPNNIPAITQAIRANESLGFNPVDDGRVVRIQVPALTEERRLQIVKLLNEKQEEAFIGLRKARHDAMDTIAAAKKDKQIGEDDATRLAAQVDGAVNTAKTDIEALTKAKEQEILKV